MIHKSVNATYIYVCPWAMEWVATAEVILLVINLEMPAYFVRYKFLFSFHNEHGVYSAFYDVQKQQEISNLIARFWLSLNTKIRLV